LLGIQKNQQVSFFYWSNVNRYILPETLSWYFGIKCTLLPLQCMAVLPCPKQYKSSSHHHGLGSVIKFCFCHAVMHCVSEILDLMAITTIDEKCVCKIHYIIFSCPQLVSLSCPSIHPSIHYPDHFIIYHQCLPFPSNRPSLSLQQNNCRVFPKVCSSFNCMYCQNTWQTSSCLCH
jgi:hypothetical protein